jgi:hypothetical protein
MTLELLLNLIPTALSVLAAIVWAVRQEGKISNTSLRLDVLEEKARSHEDTKLEVVRVQEQIKQLKELLERYLKEIHDGR